MRFKSFDIVNIVLSKTNEWLGKDFKIVNDKVKVLEQYCSAIDKIIDRNHGDEISCDVNEETLAVLIGKKPMLALYIILPLIAVCMTVFVCERNDVWTYCYIGFMSSFFGASFANILRIGEGRALNKVLGDTARNIFIYGLLTSLYIIL